MALQVTFFNASTPSSDIWTFKQVLDIVDLNNTITTLPTLKKLDERNDLLARVECNDAALMLYQCCIFIYSVYPRFTIQHISKCLKPVIYPSVTGETFKVELGTFLKLPFYIRLSIEGANRIESNQYDQMSKKIRSTDMLGIESIDLADQDSDFFSRSIELQENCQTRRALAQALQLLTDRQKTALSLRYIDDLSYQSIADLLHCSKQSVYENIQSAIKKIKAYLNTATLEFNCNG